MSCFQITSLGAYLLGALDPAERSVFERHLHTCAACREELIRLAPLPGLLGQVNLADLEQPFDDPDPYDNEPLAEVTPLHPVSEPEPKKPRRKLLLVGAGLVVALLIAAGVFIPRLVDGGPAPQVAAPPTWSATDAKTGVGAKVALVGYGWGTELRMELAHVPPGLRCKVIVHDKGGTAEIGGWWGTSHTEGEVIPGSTSFAIDKIDSLEVVADMKVLVTLRPPS